MRKKILFSFIIIFLTNSFSQFAFAGPQSTSYEIKDYSFGGGGTGESGITGASNYTLFGTAGELDASKLNGASNYSIGGGLIYTSQAGVPNAPSVTNPATNYDRLKVVLDNTQSTSATTAYGPYYPNFADGAEETGADWTNVSDNGAISIVNESNPVTNDSPSNSAPLRVTFNGVSIPGGATITGMKVDVSKYADSNGVFDWTGGHGARFLTDATDSTTHVGSDLGYGDDSGIQWPTGNYTPVSYGGENNDWGIAGLSPSMVNDPNFAFELSANVQGNNVFVNSIGLTIYVAGGSSIPAPSDTGYAIAISTDNFASDTRYIQSDNTVGSSPVFQTYSNWGGSSGFWVTGLNSNTTYYVKVKARQGNFTESGFSSVANATTSFSSLTFSLDSNSIAFANLNSGNSYTDSSKTTTLTTSTNAYNGYTVYAKETQALTTPDGNTISNFSGTNASPTTWSGIGFGYNTSDASLTGGTANRFSGSKYAGFVVSSGTNGDPVADDPGPVTSTSISNEQFTISYRVTGNNLTNAGTYSNTILYTIVAGY